MGSSTEEKPSICSARARAGTLASVSMMRSLLNHTKALDAWWKQHGGETQHLQCSCPGGDACQCEHDAENPSSEDVDVALRHETAQLLSLWWVAHGSATVVHAHPVAHPNCGHVGATGCGCRYYGCRCAHAGATGCR